MNGKIVHQGKTKDGKNFVIRYPTLNDALEMCNYINTLSKEKTFIRFQGEQITLTEETTYLNEELKKINNNRSVQLLILLDKKVVGNSSIDLKDKSESHEGTFGISIAKEIRGEGIGRLLMELVLKEAEENLPELKIITLGVFGDNELAYKMYQKFGFKEHGRLPNGSKHKDAYVDHIYMHKIVD